jgi:hypothetical protein
MRRWATTILLLSAALFWAAAPGPAFAQNDPITGFFRMLFGGGQSPPPPPGSPTVREAPRPSRPAEPKIVEVPKHPDAQVILVVGDIEAAGLATGLRVAFAEEPSIVVQARTRNVAGLVRDGESDWLQTTQKQLGEVKADFVVAMIGVNDFLPIAGPAGAKPFEPASDDWNRVYGERLDRLVGALKATGRPFWWVGLPPTADPDRKPTARAAFAAFLSGLNDLARPRVQAAGGSFVDIWNAFTDEEGHYTPTGPDIDGQVKRLRASDGVLFTRSGQRKLAFFVEEEIRKLMRGEMPSQPTLPEEQPTAQKPEEPIIAGPPPLPPAPWNTIGPAIPLGDVAADATTTLAGGPDRRPRAEMPGGYPVDATPGWRRLVEGLPLEAPAGRIDDLARRTP